MKHAPLIAVAVVVFACAVGATIAWQVAQPDPSTQRRPNPGFALLDAGEVGRLANANVAAIEQRIALARYRSRAAAAVDAWVTDTAQGGPVARGLQIRWAQAERRSTPARARDAAVVRWLNEIPHDLVGFRQRSLAVAGERAGGVATVEGTLTVSVRQTQRQVRTFDAPLTVRLAQRGSGWSVRAAELRGRDGLRAYADPVIVRRGAVDVVAPSASAHLAERVAREAAAVLPRLAARYAGVAGPARGSVYLVERSGDVSRVLGEQYVDAPRHSTAWTYQDGDVVLVLDQLPSDELRQMATVHHELAHVVTLPLLGSAPTLILEGIATWEEARHIARAGSRSIDVRPLQLAFRRDQLEYRDLLTTTRTSFGLRGARDIEVAYLASYATIGFIVDIEGRAALQRLLGRLRSGASIETALDQVLDLTPIALQRHVRVWTREHAQARGRNVAALHP